MSKDMSDLVIGPPPVNFDLPSELLKEPKDEIELKVTIPVEEKVLGPMYLQRTDCNEETVNAILSLGYRLSSITPTQEMSYKNGAYTTIASVIVYHFLRRDK